MAGQYTYLLNGAEKTMVTESGILNVTTGGARVVYKNGAISTFKAITSTSASSITQLQAVTSKGNYHFADNVQTYLYKNNGYEPTTVSAVLDSSKYSYTVWVDSDSPAGNRVRILIAQEY